MTPTPRKVRSGRRQFGPSPGTEQEWAKVMQSPHVQRAFQDPAIQQALMQHMQQQAAAAAPAAPEPPPGMAQGGALHFDTGGASGIIELQDIMRQIASLPEGPQKDQLRMRAATLQAQQSQGAGALAIPGGGNVSASTMSGVNQMVKPPTMGNTALAAGAGALMGLGTTSHQGMSALLGAGLSGALSYLIRKYGKGAQKPGDTSGGGGGGGGGGYTPTPEPQGGATPGGSVPAQPAPSVTLPTSGPTGGPESVPGLPNVGALPSSSPTGSPGGGRLMMGTANSPSGNVISRDGGKTWIDSKTPDTPYTGVVVNQTQIDPGSSLNSATPATTPPPQDSPATAGPTAQSDPNASPFGGPTFMAEQQKRFDRGLIRRGPANALAPGFGGAPLGTADLANLPMNDSAAMDPFFGTGGLGMAGGGPVPEAPPSGLKSALLAHKMPIPVLHTTIVIAAKPKKKADKKQEGGVIQPLKPQLLPPRRGPQDHDEDRPRAHGRVQVPRGSGAAIKGKRFGGIY